MEETMPILTLRERAASTLEIISAYLTAFNGDGILVFFENENDNNKNKYLERYSAFSLKLSEMLSLLERSLASVSGLIAEYEAAKAPDKADELCSVFEHCEAFFASASRFIEINEKNFKKSATFNPAHTLSSARELKSAAQTFNEGING